MEITSTSAPTLARIPHELVRACLVFLLLKATECTVKSVLLIGRGGVLTPHLWARSVLLSEAWDPRAHIRLLFGRTRYDSGGGRPVIVNRPRSTNILVLYLFFVVVLGAEVFTLMASLELQSDVLANSVRLNFFHVGRAGGSASIASNGCEWAKAVGANFELLAPTGICWANATTLTNGFVAGCLNSPCPPLHPPTQGDAMDDPGSYEEEAQISSPVHHIYHQLFDSAIYIEESKELPGQGKETRASYLTAVMVTSSGLMNRVSMRADTGTRIRDAIISFAQRHRCSTHVQGENTTIEDCRTSFEESISGGGLLGLISGGFRLRNGGVSPWEGDLRSVPSFTANTHKIGVVGVPRVGWPVLLIATGLLLLLNLVLSFFVRSDNDVAMKITMERTGGNACIEDPTACEGDQVVLKRCLMIEDEMGASGGTVGYVGTQVPAGFEEVETLKGATLMGSSVGKC